MGRGISYVEKHQDLSGFESNLGYDGQIRRQPDDGDDSSLPLDPANCSGEADPAVEDQRTLAHFRVPWQQPLPYTCLEWALLCFMTQVRLWSARTVTTGRKNRRVLCVYLHAFGLLLSVVTCGAARQSHVVHWNSSNPIFRIDNTDHIFDVNQGNKLWEYDQVDIICPLYQAPQLSKEEMEEYMIYSVSKEEYDTCRITTPSPRVIAICNKPRELTVFTITFRSFTPTPGGLEFKPGRDYYFISTSAQGDLESKVGGHCSTHNMKVAFKVASTEGQHQQQQQQPQPHHHHRGRKRPSLRSPQDRQSPPYSASSSRSSVFHDEDQVVLNREHEQGDGKEVPAGNTRWQYSHITPEEYPNNRYFHDLDQEAVKHEASRMASTSPGAIKVGKFYLVFLVLIMTFVSAFPAIVP